MSEARDTHITNLSDEELDQVAGGATAAEVADASMASDAAAQERAASREG